MKEVAEFIRRRMDALEEYRAGYDRVAKAHGATRKERKDGIKHYDARIEECRQILMFVESMGGEAVRSTRDVLKG